MGKQFVITGIGTDVGKTVVSAIVAEALEASYWKPVQAGDLDNSDSIKVQRLTKNVHVLQEAFRLNEAMSPHAAANIDGIEISLEQLNLPAIDGNLVVEGAGGVLVPINSKGRVFADLFSLWKLPVIVVSRHYLGSINHTLLTLELLKNRGIVVEGILFNGDENPASEEIILSISGAKNLGRIPLAADLNQEFVSTQAAKLKHLFL
jgi:dethiobiotin synthetase